ncbi:SDR family NAD(P)-dependent oxidoreductase [Pseudohoeflea coraliihabitans]|uniref:SDR family oxidoreductase n=1 Tax=Pseudohoeflea coraliihabitans TaxID=2860393 RepID=A0ABS6WIE4_9HYPH|nr:SDR family NAD(P)-dependent oxidoreductase [Pseudohoeflea sp. DP4N28-3]MBW3095696.1 SDR family oxidoreductase [Pseudohoeflea sp. DP4N28-3]
MNQIDLKDRTAVVTGGAQGIGRAVAERLTASGATVCLWDKDAALAERTAAELGAGTSFLAVDLTDFAAVEKATAETEARLGRIDILIANAGIAGANAPVADYPVEEWRRIVDINLNGVFYCCKTVVAGMARRNYGRIVNLASIAGKEGNPNAAAYSASKAGVIALTKSLGKEMAGHDIAVNCVTPAAARTRIFDQMSQEHIDYMLSRIPRGRFLELDEAAAMIAWLVSAENTFATGAVFDLSGGRATY